MTSPPVPDFDVFIKPLVGGADVSAIDQTPLSRLPAGDYAVLAWLDDVQSRLPPGIEADIVARWDSVTLRDVYGLFTAWNAAARGLSA